MPDIDMKVDEALMEKERRRFRIEKQDLELLHEIGGQFEPFIGPLADETLRHILSFPECVAVFKDESSKESSKQKILAGEKAHLAKLFSGAIDEEFFRMGFHIGLLHGRLGIEPAWYLACYASYVDFVMWRLSSQAQSISPERLSAILCALSKVMTLDISLAWEAYYRQREQKIRDTYQVLELDHNMSLTIIEERDKDIAQLLKRLAENRSGGAGS